MKQKVKSIRDKFVKEFGEGLAEQLEAAAMYHGYSVGVNMGSDPFKWVLLTCIDFQCFEKDRFRKFHGIPKKPSYTVLKRWIRDNAELGTHDGNYNRFMLASGAYDYYLDSYIRREQAPTKRLIPKKIQIRKKAGWIVELIWGDRLADCFCVRHLRHWKEGASFADGACRECLAD